MIGRVEVSILKNRPIADASLRNPGLTLFRRAVIPPLLDAAPSGHFLFEVFRAVFFLPAFFFAFFFPPAAASALLLLRRSAACAFAYDWMSLNFPSLVRTA